MQLFRYTTYPNCSVSLMYDFESTFFISGQMLICHAENRSGFNKIIFGQVLASAF